MAGLPTWQTLPSNGMTNVQKIGFVTAFLVLCLFIGISTNETVLTWFLVLVLVSMILFNTTKFMAFFNTVFKV